MISIIIEKLAFFVIALNLLYILVNELDNE